MAHQGERGNGAERSATSRWEWIAAAVSTLLVLSVLGLLLHDAVARPQTPPAVTVLADSATRAGGVWRVEFTAHNGGHSTAAGVRVTGELMRGDSAIERSEATLDYVPGRATRRGGLFFRRDPRAHTLRLQAHGYQEP